MARIDGFRSEAFFTEMFTDGFADRVQAALSQGEGMPSAGPGLTTHISTVDESGGAVSITHSLGETCGEMVDGTGMLVNNFLGEADVNPPSLGRPPGSRLITMCCPSIIERGHDVFALGSGGSSRIPTAVLHGALYLVDHHLSAAEAVAGPRTHLESGQLHVETDGRSAATIAVVEGAWPDLIRFDGPNMFFGGLHMAGIERGAFTGAGDHRRSGSYGTYLGRNT
jgi:gamma-glutamyltranspeptidase/glutathione hydrolase